MLASAFASGGRFADSPVAGGVQDRPRRFRRDPGCRLLCQNRGMELTWYGRTCVRLRGKDAVVGDGSVPVGRGADGRGITGDIVTFSHPDDRPLPKAKGKPSRDGRTFLPSSLDDSFVLDGPGEYEVKEVLVTGVRTYRDDAKGAEFGQAGLVRRRDRWRAHHPPLSSENSAISHRTRIDTSSPKGLVSIKK